MSSIFKTPELAIGIAVGGAAGAAFEPKLEVPKQKAWAANQVLLPDLGLIAALVAGGKITPQDGHDMAGRLGFSSGTMDSITWLAQNRLEFAQMLRMWRRFGAFSADDDAALSHLLDVTLAHEQLDWDYQPWLRKMKLAEVVGLGDIAMGIVRSALPAPAYVPVPPPTEGLTVPRFPQVNIDPEKLAAALGFPPEMLQLMVARSGLSLAPGLAAQALFRGLINDQDFLLAVAEGDLRTEWAEKLRDASRQILTAGEYAELELRGFYDKTTRRERTAQHGMSERDSDDLYDVMGRAPSVHTVLIGLRRGGVYDGPTDHIPQVFIEAMQRSNLRPEWYNIAYAARESYPSAFVIRALLQGGAIDATTGQDLFDKLGWPEDLAATVATHYGRSTTATADPHVTSEQTKLRNTIHTSYKSGEIDAAAATDALPTAGVAADSIPAIMAIWDVERSIPRKTLTAAQIKKGYRESAVNEATGAAWTKDEALAALIELGYSTERADSFLNI